MIIYSSGSSGRVRGGPRNMKSMGPPLAAIFFMTYFHRARGAMAPSAPPPLDPLLIYHIKSIHWRISASNKEFREDESPPPPQNLLMDTFALVKYFSWPSGFEMSWKHCNFFAHFIFIRDAYFTNYATNFCFQDSGNPVNTLNGLKSIYNSHSITWATHLIHTCFPIISSNGLM